MLCLDTNVVIAIFNERPRIVLKRFLEALATEDVCLPAMTYFELWHGACSSERSVENKKRIKVFSSPPIQVLKFDADDGEHAGDIYSYLKRVGTPIGHYDLLIAAQARRRDATLVTANMSEFNRVPGLKVEDWTRD